MRLKYLFATSAMALGFAATCHADWVAKQAPMCDLSKAGTSTFTKRNASILSVGTSAVGPTATIKFDSYLASFGQEFTTPKDWSAYNLVHILVTNNSSVNQTYKLITQYYQDPNNYTNAFTGAFTILAKSTRHFVFYLNIDDPKPYGLKYLNPVLSDQSFQEIYSSNVKRDLRNSWRWRLSYQGSTPNQITISDMRLLRQSLDFTGLVDWWGQYTDRSWPNKITDNSQFASQLQKEKSDNAAKPGPGETTGTTKLSNPAATLGKWSVVSYPNGNKFLQHPNGKLFWSLGLNAVEDTLPTPIQGREHYFDHLPDPTGYYASCYSTLSTSTGTKLCFSFRQQNLMIKYGANYKAGWDSMVKSRLNSWGINTVGIDSDTAIMAAGLPFAIDIKTSGFGTRVRPPMQTWGSLPDPYASGFQSWCQTNFKSWLSKYVGNQNFMGAFVDNEMSWGTMESNEKRYNVVLGVLAASSTSPAKNAFVNMLRAKYSTIGALNNSWGTGFADFGAILISTTWKPANYPSALVADFKAFTTQFSAKYYSQVRAALIYAGLKSLYMGSRYSHYTNEVVSGALDHVDLVSFNVYRYAAEVPWAYYNSLKKPVIISEFGFGLRGWGTFGGPAVMAGSAGRAFRIQEFLNQALKQPNVVGAHYYCYGDQPITGRYSDYENGGFGIVDIVDAPYPESVNALRSFSSNMYSVRGAATTTTSAP